MSVRSAIAIAGKSEQYQDECLAQYENDRQGTPMLIARIQLSSSASHVD